MQAVGLLKIGTKRYSERILLNEFLKQGYFLIDASPVPLTNKDENSLAKNAKMEKLRLYQDSLLETIRELNPLKIIFMCETNMDVLNRVKNDKVLGERLLSEKYLPFAGNGQQSKLKKAFPEEYRLKPIYSGDLS